MESTSTEFEVPRAVQRAAALGGLVIDAYLAAHESRQARAGSPQPVSKRPPFAEVLKQAGSSIPGLQEALVALAGEENVADLKKLADLVGGNPDLGELVRKATMNARGVATANAAPSSARRARAGEEPLATPGASLTRDEEADARARLLAMLRSSVDERLTLMDARLNGRVSALQQRVVHLEASIDGLAQDIERLKKRSRERRDAAVSMTAAAREVPQTVPSAAHSDPAPSREAATAARPVVSMLSSATSSIASPPSEWAPSGEVVTTMTRTLSPPEQTGSQTVDVERGDGPEMATLDPVDAVSISASGRGHVPTREAAALTKESPAAESGAGEDRLLMALLDARESDHDARIAEGENAVAILERHVITLTAQVRELSELQSDV